MSTQYHEERTPTFPYSSTSRGEFYIFLAALVIFVVVWWAGVYRNDADNIDIRLVNVQTVAADNLKATTTANAIANEAKDKVAELEVTQRQMKMPTSPHPPVKPAYKTVQKPSGSTRWRLPLSEGEQIQLLFSTQTPVSKMTTAVMSGILTYIRSIDDDVVAQEQEEIQNIPLRLMRDSKGQVSTLRTSIDMAKGPDGGTIISYGDDRISQLSSADGVDGVTLTRIHFQVQQIDITTDESSDGSAPVIAVYNGSDLKDTFSLMMMRQ